MTGRAAVALRLGGFVLLIAVIFSVAYLVGVRIGPVSPARGHGHGGSGGGGGGGMTMSTIFARSAAAAAAAPEWGAAR